MPPPRCPCKELRARQVAGSRVVQPGGRTATPGGHCDYDCLRCQAASEGVAKGVPGQPELLETVSEEKLNSNKQASKQTINTLGLKHVIVIFGFERRRHKDEGQGHPGLHNKFESILG